MFRKILLIIQTATIALFIIGRLVTGRLVRQHYGQRSDLFRRCPIQPGDVVFVGDSLTDGAPWEELFPDVPIKNRGINADTTSGVLARLGDILRGQPAAIFILIGTNDLPWYMLRGNAKILSDYETILRRCKQEIPQTRVYVQSLLPRSRFYARRIQRFNPFLEQLAKNYGYTYINVHPHLADQNGAIRPEFTNDNLHLMAEGYACWVEVLRPYLEPFARKS